MENIQSFQASPRRLCFVRLVLCGVLLWLLPWRAWAQLESQSTMYFAVPTLYNPAAAGCDSALHVTANNRLQWVGADDAPNTLFASVDAPIMLGRKRLGLGFTVLNDQAGLFATTFLNVQVNASMKLWGGRLAIGVQPGFVNQSFDGSDVYIPTGDAWDASDEAIPQESVSGMAFDLGIGIFYERGWWYGGLAANHLMGSEIELDTYAYSELTRTLYAYGGGHIPIKQTPFVLKPSFLVKTTGQFTQYDLTFRADWNRRYWGGVTYRHGDAVALMVGAVVGHVQVGYSYDIPLSQMGVATGGSHEILATYTLHIDLEKSHKQPSKSIRIL